MRSVSEKGLLYGRRNHNFTKINRIRKLRSEKGKKDLKSDPESVLIIARCIKAKHCYFRNPCA
jgi:hypothetical protein